MGLHILSEKEIQEVEEILDMGVPILWSKIERKSKPFAAGMHIHYVSDKTGTLIRIDECIGYNVRNLIEVIKGEWHVINNISPYLYGVFYNDIEALNKYENHPLIKHSYSSALVNGWSPDNSMLRHEDLIRVNEVISNAYKGVATCPNEIDKVVFSSEIINRDFCNFTLHNKISGVIIEFKNVSRDDIFSVFGWQGLNWARS